MFFSAKREAQTSLDCPICHNNLFIKRTCYEAYMFCASCQKTFPLQDFIPQIDETMENFLENLYSDRI